VPTDNPCKGSDVVDFDKLIGREPTLPTTDPLEIFAKLERGKGKEFPRPAQDVALATWRDKHRSAKDAVIKLPTGHGKTLIGLLILQSYLNETHRPVVYLCPNTYLVTQTVAQAREFGIRTCEATDAAQGTLPGAFLNGESIFVTTCQKLFNGKTLFGGPATGRPAVEIEAIVMDDAHRCVEEIREAFSIRVSRGSADSPDPLYAGLVGMFTESLRRQAHGSLTGILEGGAEFLLVPYWSWLEREGEVLALLQGAKDHEGVEFVWDFLKNHLKESRCMVSGGAVEISPRLLPLREVPSFERASHRIFLSATLAEDSFLIRDFGVASSAVLNPIVAGDIKYCGERLILLPTLVKPTIQRDELIKWVTGLSRGHPTLGFVVLAPDQYRARDWEGLGAEIVRVREIEKALVGLRAQTEGGGRSRPLVLLNQYDGIDLPDDVCRVLCIDSLPSWTTLWDRYSATVRSGEAAINRKLAQRIEQGMGRGIRGPNDWCVVVVAGNNLTGFLAANANKQYLSPEAQAQIAIGEELAREMSQEGKSLSVVSQLIEQCVRRDEKWKNYYRQRMSKVSLPTTNAASADRAEKERLAELEFEGGRPDRGEATLQSLAEAGDPLEKGWYFQLLAEHLYVVNRPRALDLQIRAQRENHYLLKPEAGLQYERISARSEQRAKRILDWLKQYASLNEALVALNSTLDKLAFGGDPKVFEEGVKELGVLLGFLSQRPEAELGAGPDNFWSLGTSKYWVIECKNEVLRDRRFVSKDEAGQMSNSIAWFKERYSEGSGRFVFVHPAATLARDAFLADEAFTLTPSQLGALKATTLAAYTSLKDRPFSELSEKEIEGALHAHALVGDKLETDHLTHVGKAPKR
jgi:hypothetical protein